MIAAIDARASRLGQKRSRYLLDLVERDLAEEKKPRRHVFASADLIGAFNLLTGPATNANTRRIMAEKLRRRPEKHR